MSKTRGTRNIDELLDVMARLRDPVHGCPWDVEQDFASIAPYTVEEAYEVAEAIARGDMADLADELGDLLLQVVFHAQMASEAGHFGFGHVVRNIVDKMVRRHPHVFADAPRPDVAAQGESWERIKAGERRQRGEAEADSVLDGAGRGLPPLKRAAALQRRAARVGFDWPAPAPVIDKLAEEVDELREACGSADAGRQAAELGDVLFSCVNLARHLGIDAEQALAGANARFERRFRHLEAAARRRGGAAAADAETLDALWTEAKRATPDD